MTMQFSSDGQGPVPTESSVEASARNRRRTGSRSAANAAMNRYATGDDDAFSALYPVLAPELRKYLLRQTRNASRAAVQPLCQIVEAAGLAQAGEQNGARGRAMEPPRDPLFAPLFPPCQSSSIRVHPCQRSGHR